MRILHLSKKIGIIITIIASFGITVAYSSTSTILEPVQSIQPFDSDTVTISESTFTDILPMESSTVIPTSLSQSFSSTVVDTTSATFTDILPMESSTVIPTSLSQSFSSTVVATTSITGIHLLSSISPPTISNVMGTNVEFTPIMGVVESSISSPSISNAMGTNIEFTPIMGVVESSISPPSVSNVDGLFLAVNQIILDPSTTSYSFDSIDGFTELIITPEGIALNIITIPSDVSGTAMNGGSNLTIEGDGSKTLSFANGFSINAVTADVSVDVVFPDNLEINGPDEWDGVINLPTIKSTSLVDLGEGVEPTAVIEIGADDTPLTLNNPIQLTFDGQGDKQVFFTQGGVTTEITTVCSGNTLADNIGLSEGGDCKITVASDLVVWTKHMTLASLGVPITNNPPDCSAALPSVDIISKANNKLVDVTINGVTDSDGDPITITITGITQDETTSELKGKDKSPDGFGVGTDTAQIRAQKDSKGNGRVYEISFDANGGMCNDSVNVVVPKNKKTVPVDDGQSFDSTLP